MTFIFLFMILLEATPINHENYQITIQYENFILINEFSLLFPKVSTPLYPIHLYIVIPTYSLVTYVPITYTNSGT